jgi:hypothetical protein
VPASLSKNQIEMEDDMNFLKGLKIGLSAAVILGVTVLSSCINRPMKNASPDTSVIPSFEVAVSQNRDVDILFVIDDSLSMKDEQVKLRSQFGSLMGVLQNISGGLPNIHIGVTSTDLGTSPYNLLGCETPGGREGNLLKGEYGDCLNPTGSNYIVNIEPKQCDIKRDEGNQCSFHDCNQNNCNSDVFTVDGVSTEPSGLMFYEDSNGCPRCRNYSDDNLEGVFGCIADIGVDGCGLEQPLEAMKMSLTPGSHHDEGDLGFVREKAYLAVVFITDEDDGSAKSGDFFNSDTSIDSNLGPFEFRSWEFGVVCDEPWLRTMGTEDMEYHNCKARSNDDPKNLLVPPDNYGAFLKSVKDPSMIIVAAIAGPSNGTVVMGLNEYNNPGPKKVCGAGTKPTDGAVPGVRLKEFISGFNSEVDMSWAYTSVCDEDYTPALVGLGMKIKKLVEVACITTPLDGCPDPAAANGFEPLTQLDETVRDTCQPLCSVMLVETNSAGTEIFRNIDQCPADYMDGHPLKSDPNLPVSNCFHVLYNPKCAIGPDLGPSRGAEIVISHKVQPPLGSYVFIKCRGLALVEQLCFDGIDNDMDGQIDSMDEDCNPTVI